MEHFKDMPASPQTVDQYCFDAQYILFVPLLFVPALFFPLLFVSSIWNWDLRRKRQIYMRHWKSQGTDPKNSTYFALVFLGKFPKKPRSLHSLLREIFDPFPPWLCIVEEKCNNWLKL